MNKKNNIPALPEVMIRPHIQAALLEDFGTGGDITSRACFPDKENVKAELVARESGRLSGLQAALLTFEELDSDIKVSPQLQEGSDFTHGTVLAEISGPVSSVLSAERVALNYLTHLSAVASYTAKAVQIIEQAGSETRIAATRKTLPGLRMFQKQAVLHGGGWPHRYGLSDAVMLKDNHIAAIGKDVASSIQSIRSQLGHMVCISVEVDRLDQIDAVLEGKADVILLDNMSTDQIQEAIQHINKRATVEVSGGVSLENLVEAALLGVDVISMGALTHSAGNIDIGLDLK